MHHFQIVIFQQAGQRENIAHIVVHHQHLLADQRDVGFAQLFQDAALVRRQIGFGAMQQQHRFVQQPFARLNRPDDARAPQPRQLQLFVGVSGRSHISRMGGAYGPAWL